MTSSSPSFSGYFKGISISISALREQIRINATTVSKEIIRVYRALRRKRARLVAQKKLEDATNLVGHTKIENINLKVELQTQKDFVMALKLKLEDTNPTSGKIVKETSECVIVKETENVSKEEGPLPECEQKCDKCNYRNKNRVLLQAHKDKRHNEIPRQKCRMCGFIANGLESIKEHKQQHQRELNVGHISTYPMNVYTFKCTPCEQSFKTHDDLMEHMVKEHLTEEHRNGKRFVDSAKKIEEATHSDRPALCKNGPQCYYHRQSRCNFYHDQPPKQKQVRSPRQPPTDHWKTVPHRRQHGNQPKKAHNQWQPMQAQNYHDNNFIQPYQQWAHNNQWQALPMLWQENNQAEQSYYPQQQWPQTNTLWGGSNFTNPAYQSWY